jgi:hypothetical protein
LRSTPTRPISRVRPFSVRPPLRFSCSETLARLFPLSGDNPTYSLVKCAAEYAPELDENLRSLVKKSIKSDKALKQLGDVFGQDPLIRALVGTTQAVDLISGGVKVGPLLLVRRGRF